MASNPRFSKGWQKKLPTSSRWMSKSPSLSAAAISSAASPPAPTGMERASADYMGMLATVLNALALQNALEGRASVPVSVRHRDASVGRRLHSPARHPPFGKETCRDFCRRNGQPYFSTDTAASLGAMEIGAQVIMKKAPRSTAFTTASGQNPQAKSTMRFPSSRFSPRISKSWIRPPSACAWTTDCR